MQRFLSIFMACCVALTLSLDAHAKRFGGGQSMGSAPSHQTRDIQSQRGNPTVQPQPGRQQPAPAPSGASRWLGPLAGIAAGGLLASMFMGDGFEGFQFLDFLILALIAFFIFRFIKARRQRQQAGLQPAMANHSLSRDMSANPQMAYNSSTPVAIKAPAWFNEARFIEAARTHFMALQQHWDANEMDKIAEFVTPQMLELLKRERQDTGEANQSTDIENLNVQLDGVDDLADKTVATVTFSGLSKNSRFDKGEAFSESWRMERAQGQNQPWLIAGIRQN